MSTKRRILEMNLSKGTLAYEKVASFAPSQMVIRRRLLSDRVMKLRRWVNAGLMVSVVNLHGVHVRSVVF